MPPRRQSGSSQVRDKWIFFWGQINLKLEPCPVRIGQSVSWNQRPMPYRLHWAPLAPPTRSTTMKNADLQARKEAATPRGVAVRCDFFADKAENALLWDVEGNRYIDFASGIAVLNTGHRHPRLVAAIEEQLGRFKIGRASCRERGEV